MANMSYCRFENTLRDLQDCYEHMDDPNLSSSEERARQGIIDLCYNIVENYGDEIDEEV